MGGEGKDGIILGCVRRIQLIGRLIQEGSRLLIGFKGSVLKYIYIPRGMKREFVRLKGEFSQRISNH